jgi:hypothetical protein
MDKQQPMEKRQAGVSPKAQGQKQATEKTHEFDKPLGSSHNDKVDLRDLTEKAAQKSE